LFGNLSSRSKRSIAAPLRDALTIVQDLDDRLARSGY
jgi:hypothetical protein